MRTRVLVDLPATAFSSSTLTQAVNELDQYIRGDDIVIACRSRPCGGRADDQIAPQPVLHRRATVRQRGRREPTAVDLANAERTGW